MPEFDTVADLREALTANDPDRRAQAYGDVMAEDVQPSAILDTPPDETALETLRDADVLDEERGAGRSMRDVNDRIVELLEDIRDELQDDVVAQDGGGA